MRYNKDIYLNLKWNLLGTDATTAIAQPSKYTKYEEYQPNKTSSYDTISYFSLVELSIVDSSCYPKIW